MQNATVSLRPKLPALSALAIVLVALSVGVSLRGNLHGAWNMIHIPANTPFFSDTRGFTHAIDCVLHGQDPYTVSTYDPWHRLYNYPPAWLEARYLGITSRSSNLIGIALAAFAICAYVMLFNARTTVSALIVLLALTSRCVLLAVERGNTDQGVFFLLVLGFFLIDRQRPELRTRLTALLISLLTVIKLYPIAAVTVFLDRRRGALKAAVTSLVALTALLLTAGAKLPLVLANTPHDRDMSFGTFPFFYAVTQHTVRSISPAILAHPGATALAAVMLSLASMLAGVAMGDRIDRFLPRLRSDHPRGAIAIACLSIFCFAFAAGSSFDYRLIYLMGALAFLVEDINEGSLRSVPAAILILTLLWKPFWLSILGEASDGLVFIMASAWLGNSLYRGQTEALARNPAHPFFDPLRSRRSASA